MEEETARKLVRGFRPKMVYFDFVACLVLKKEKTRKPALA